MPLIYYWRPDNYRKDQEFGFGYHLNQSSPAMANATPGDSLWAFTRRESDGQYVIAAEMVVRALTRTPLNYRYGVWRIWGDLDRSRYFDTATGPNADPLIRSLGIPAGAEMLGRSFQGHAAVRVIPESAHRTLVDFCRNLRTLSRVGIYPEDEFEARLVHERPVEQLVDAEQLPEADKRLRYLFETVDIRRARKHVAVLQELYSGRCQICRYDPAKRYGHRICHGHHIQWLSRGGVDELENMVLVCPNHHGAIHRDDASFDYADLSFSFENGLRERLAVNRHLATPHPTSG